MAKSSTTTLPDALPSTSLTTSDDRARVLAYYEGSNLDYRFWSRRFQMHFGYYRWGLNPFNREGMLREMNQQVLSRLGLGERAARVVDLGCGLGAPARDAAKRYPHWEIDAVSLVPWQIQYAGELTLAEGGVQNLRFTVADYADTPFDTASFDGGYALESSCHAAGDDKHDFVREAARLLKPGARLVVADGFIEREPIPWPLSSATASRSSNPRMRATASHHLPVMCRG
jgi:MPBQ/MSBQ methyltransferase